VSLEQSRTDKRLRIAAIAMFVLAGVLAAGAVYAMYKLGTDSDDRDDLARLGLLLTGVALVLVIAGALVRDRTSKEDESEDRTP
jgi:hypothetical protein